MSVSVTSSESATVEVHRVARATAVIAFGNITSRILGLARETILSYLFGASVAVDAFKIATIVPRGLYDLLIGGHVNSALVPVLSEYAEKEDRNNLWQLISALLWIAVVGMALLVVGIELAAPYIIRVVASDEVTPEILDEATVLLRITAPALFFLSLFAVVSSLLYALRRFTWPAFAASAFNLTIVAMTAAFAQQIGITAAALGWLLGAIVQLVIQWPGLQGIHLQLHFLWRHPGVRTIALLYVPVMFSLVLDVLINRPFSYNLASRTGEGSIAYMEWATTLVQFPQGLVATAVSIAVLPTLSRQATYKDKGLAEFKNTLGLGLRLSLALIIPATIGLIVFAAPIVALVFEHGEFTSADTLITAKALRLYMLGLPFAALDLLLVYSFYARQDTLTPAAVGVVSLVAYMVTVLALLDSAGLYALMIADSVKHCIHASISGWLLLRRIGGLSHQRLVETAGKAMIAALVMGLVGKGMLYLLEPSFGDSKLVDELVLVVGAGGASGVLYLFLADRLGVEEIQLFFKKIRQKLAARY